MDTDRDHDPILTRLTTHPLSRRRLLRLGALAASATLATSLLAACGGDDDEEDAGGEATAATGGEATSASDGGEATEGAAAATEPASADEGTPKPGGTLIWGMGGDADALDPHTTNAWAAWRQSTMMYESLCRKDLLVEEGTPEIVPLLAESWEANDDATVWTFALRQGVKFHDGTDFNAAAVVANYERNAVPDSKYYYANAWHGSVPFSFTEKVETPDDVTITFTHSEPVGEFLAQMGDYYWFGIASPTQIEKVGNENLAANPSGTGPFVFVERKEGDRTEFKRNEDYWGEKAWLEKVIVRPILEDQARVVALETGEIDLMSDPPPDVIQQLLDKGFTLKQGPASHVAYYRFHFQNEHASNLKVRQAVQYAINRESIAKDLFRDTALPAYGLLTPGSPAYQPDWKPFEFDPDKARALMKEAGYESGFKTKILAAPTASGWPLAGAVAQFIKSNLADIGIDAELELTEWVTYLGIDFRSRTDALMWGTAWGMPTHFFLNIEAESVYESEESTYATFYNTLENPIPEVDNLLISARREADPQKAIDLYRQANERICVTDSAFLCLTHDKLPHMMKDSVNGFIHSVNVNYDLSKVWIAD